MNTITASSDASIITAGLLAERLAGRDPVTVLDIRDDARWAIRAPGVTALHVPADRAFADPGALADSLEGPIAVVCSRGMTAGRLTTQLRALDVDAMTLQGGMRAWIAALQTRPVELGIDGLAVYQIQRPGRGCLSYLLASGGRALVVDPAPDAGFYEDLARQAGARVTVVVDTHLHADHISGARALAASTGAALRLPAAALERGVAYADGVEALYDGDTIALGVVTVRAIALPGHTTDMTGLLIDDRALLGGDSVFADGIARPDLQEGDPEGARAMARILHSTLRQRVLTLGDDVLLLPGHTHPGVNAGAVAATLAEVRRTVGELSIEDPAEFADALLAAMPPRPENYAAIIAVNSGTQPADPELESGANSCSTR